MKLLSLVFLPLLWGVGCASDREVTPQSLALVHATVGQPIRGPTGDVLFYVPEPSQLVPEGEDAIRERSILHAKKLEESLGSRKHVRTAEWVNDELLWYIPILRGPGQNLVNLICYIDATLVDPIDRLRKFQVGGYHVTISGDLKNRRTPYIMVQVTF